MKKLILLLALFCSSLAGLSPTPAPVFYITEGVAIRPYEDIWQAVCIVESSNNPLAHNVKENAVGIAQIRQVRINDYNRRTGEHYKLKEMYDPAKAKSVFMYYAMEIGENNAEKIIRCWNGGENGMKKRSTKAYYYKVRRYLQNN